ncbi:MAG: DUF3352 domain-containing protein [Cyanobacteriota bacterium]|jgi:hypothetical protein
MTVNRSQGLSCGGCLGLLLALGTLGAGGWWAYGQGWFGGGKGSLTALDAAQVIPDEALGGMFVKVEDPAWPYLASELETETLPDWQEELERTTQINWSRDIQPWLGNIFLAALPGEGENLEWLGVAALRDPGKARQFFDQLQRRPQVESQKQDVQGTEIVELRGQDPQGRFSYAFWNNRLLLASSPAGIVAALATQADQPSLAQVEDKRRILSERLNLKNPVIQIYGLDPRFWSGESVLGKESGELAQSAAGEIRFFLGGLSLAPEGLHLQALWAFNSEETVGAWGGANPNQLLEELPENTIFLLNGQGISQGWRQLAANAVQEPEVEAGLDQAREVVQSTLGLDLDQDLMDWLDGEFALALIPAPGGFSGDWGLSGVILLETSQGERGRAVIPRLEQNLEQRVGLFLKSQSVPNGDDPLTEWRTLQGQTALAYGWLNAETFSIALGNSLAPLLAVNPKTSLAQSAAFKTLSAGLPRQNSGYFYLNLGAALPLLEKIAALQGETLPPPTLETLKGLAVVGAVSVPAPDRAQMDVKVRRQKN